MARAILAVCPSVVPYRIKIRQHMVIPPRGASPRRTPVRASLAGPHDPRSVRAARSHGSLAQLQGAETVPGRCGETSAPVAGGSGKSSRGTGEIFGREVQDG